MKKSSQNLQKKYYHHAFLQILRGGVKALLLLVLSLCAQAQNTFTNTGPNVGIGTTSPSSKLEVLSESQYMGSTFGWTNLNPTLSLEYTYDHGSAQQMYTIPSHKILDISTKEISGGGSSITNQFSVYKGAVSIGNVTNPLHTLTVGGDMSCDGIENYGNLSTTGAASFGQKVSIGSLQPTGPYTNYMLSVDGDIICKRYVVQTTNWADHVFADTYQLRPLKEVASFIQDYKHLPDMPSETEVIAKGLDVSEMLQLQQQKIEELTLYLLQQQDEINTLKEKLQNHD